MVIREFGFKKNSRNASEGWRSHFYKNMTATKIIKVYTCSIKFLILIRIMIIKNLDRNSAEGRDIQSHFYKSTSAHGTAYTKIVKVLNKHIPIYISCDYKQEYSEKDRQYYTVISKRLCQHMALPIQRWSK